MTLLSIILFLTIIFLIIGITINRDINNIYSIKNICDKYNITNYTMNDDGSIDVNGDVNLSSRNLTKLPLKFRNVSGDFNCSSNKKLISLEGSPIFVGGNFNCTCCSLKSLQYGPTIVGDDYLCSHNQLSDLIGSPKKIKGDLECSYNPIKTFKGCPQRIIGKFLSYGTLITGLSYFPEICENYNLSSGSHFSKVIDYYFYKRFGRYRLENLMSLLIEYTPITDDKIIIGRLEEVYFELGLPIPEMIYNIDIPYSEIFDNYYYNSDFKFKYKII